MRRLRHAGAAALLVLAAVLVLGGCGRGSTSPASAPATTVATAAEPAHPEVGFRSRTRLEEHFRKHGAEFGSITQDEYLRQAQTLRDRPVGGAVLESVRDDGVATRFDRATGAFVAFNRDLTIRTFFRPNDGEDYFRRQARR